MGVVVERVRREAAGRPPTAVRPAYRRASARAARPQRVARAMFLCRAKFA